MAIAALDRISKVFRGRPAIDQVTLAVEVGEMLALTGPSGAGKSTILNILGLLETPSSGTLKLFDAPAPRPGTAAAGRLLRRRLGYLFQNYALIDRDTVEKNLRVAQTYSGGGRGAHQNARTRALEAVGLTGYEQRPVYELSGGEQQRLAIARLILTPRDLILADEPTGSLDAENRGRVLELLAGLRANGATIVIVTHDPIVSEFCDRTLALPEATGTI